MKRTKILFFVVAAVVLISTLFYPFSYSAPLTVHPANRRYVTDGTGRAIYLTGSHTWFLVQKASFYGQVDNSYQNMEDYLNWVQSYNHNFQRLWTNFADYQGPFPWARTGPGTAWDGGLKFNMSQFDQSYFDMLRQRVLQITNRGMYCSVMLFGSGNEFRPEWPGTDGTNWSKCSWNPVNNINSALASALSTTNGDTFYTSNASAMDIQKALIRKTVDTLNDIDNLMWEVINEPKYPASTTWQSAMVSYIRSYESGKPKQHLVGMVGGWNEAGQILFDSTADWISPENNPGGYKDDGGEPTYTAKVILSDTDHLWGFSDPAYAEAIRKWVWKTFASGHHPIFMDTYDACFQPYQCGSVDTRFTRVRAAMGHTLAYANKMDLVNVTPQPSLASTGYCLAKAGYEYLVYFPSGGSATLNLTSVSGTFSAKWFNPYSGGSEIDGGTTTGGAVRSFTPPFSGDAVLYLVSGSGTPPTCNITGLTLINADTNQPVSGYDPISDGATLNLDTLPTRNLNVRANTDPSIIGSVRFGLDGNTNYRTESGAPYALAGDASGDYYAWTPSAGSHILTATPYTGAGATGTAGTTFTLNFSVTDQSGGPVSGLVGYWKFDEGSGTTASDSSGNGNTGTLQNGPAWVTGKYGYGLNFDGVDDAVNVGSNAILDDITTITIAAWIKPNSIGETYGRIFGKEWRDEAVHAFFVGAWPGYTPPCLLYQRCWTHGEGLYSDSLWTTNSRSITLGAWQHVAVTYNAGSVNNNAVLYLNGVSQTKLFRYPTSGSPVSDASFSGIIGNAPAGTRTFDGVIDEVRIYNRILSASEIQAIAGGEPVPDDTTAPVVPASVWDGTGSDVDSTSLTTQLSANWDASNDNESGISGYRYAIGTSAGSTNVAGWTTIGNVTAVTKTGLTLSVGTTYYFSIKAVNGAGLESSARNSNGQYVKNVVPGGDSVVSFTLINADTDQPVSGYDPISDGVTLNLTTLLTVNLNIRANTEPSTVGSVKFGLDGNVNYRTETVAPYALAGDTSGNYNPWTPAVGSHVLTATPYTGAGATGTAGNALTISFNVTDQSNDTTPPSAPAVVRDGTGADVSQPNSLTQLSANWDAGTDVESGISGYKYAIGTTVGGTNTVNWTTIGNVTTVTKTGLTLSVGTTYYFSVKAINGASPELESANAANSNGQYASGSTPPSNLTAYWKFDEGTGNSVTDYSGNGNTGTLYNNPSWTTGKVNGGIGLDGVDDTVSCGYTLSKDNFTMCAWVKATTTHEVDTESSSGWAGVSGQRYLFGATKQQANAGAGVSAGTNGISVYEHGAAYMPPLAVYSGTIGTGWNHIVIVYENKQPKIYLNGTLVRTGLTSARPEVYVSTSIGGGEYGHFPGTIDEVKIYPVALTSQEVLDLYDSYSTDITPPSNIAVIRDGTGVDTSYTNLTTQLSANWDTATDTESGISKYYYAIGSLPGATDIYNWTTNGTATSVTRTGLSLLIGTTYYFSVKAENGSGLQSSAANSDGQVVLSTSVPDTTAPVGPATVRDGASVGTDVDSTVLTMYLSANWDNATDIESGISGYYYAIGTSPGATNVANWSNSGTATLATRTGLSLIVGTTYYFSVMAVNSQGLTGTAVNSNGQYVKWVDTGDTTPPGNIAVIRDGAGSDVDYTILTTELSANWDASTDADSGVDKYYYAIGTTAGGSNIIGWTDNGPFTNVTKTGLTLVKGAMYYFSVKAENAVGLQSSTTTSNGQYVFNDEIEDVIISSVQAKNITANSVTITWITDKPAMSQVEYGLTFGYGNNTGENVSLVTSHSVNITGLMSNSVYHYRVKSRQTGGNTVVSGDFNFATLPAGNENVRKAHPNPADFRNGDSRVTFEVSGNAGGEAKIYTLTGKLVKKLSVGSGITEIQWDGKNEAGQKVVRGIYIYRITDNTGNKATGKLAVIR